MSKGFLYGLFFAVMCTYPKQPDKAQISALLESGDKDSLILGAYYAGEVKDTSYIGALLDIAYDPRISHNKGFYGVSVTQSAVAALEKITGKTPPNKKTYKIDSANIDFYIKYNQSNRNQGNK